MKKYLLLLLILLISLSACSIIDSDESSTLSAGTPFQLKVGETADIEGHKFTFKEVSSDSRCPIDAKCIWAGEATVHLVSIDDEGNEADIYISTNSTDAYVPLFPQTLIEDNCVNDICSHVYPPYHLGYLISLNSITPDHEVGKELQQSDYIATFTFGLSI